MSKLAQVSDVRSLIRSDSALTELETSIGLFLEAASPAMEDKIRTRFDQDERYDIFKVIHHEIYPGVYEYHWRLTNGFVDSGEDFTVRVADKIEYFGTNDELDITAQCTVDYERGLVSVVAGRVNDLAIPDNESRIIGNFVRIDYTSGFTVTSEVYQSVPDWLKYAACYHAIIQLDALNPAQRHSDEDSRFSLNQLKGVYNSLFTGRIRYFPSYQNPVMKT